MMKITPLCLFSSFCALCVVLNMSRSLKFLCLLLRKNATNPKETAETTWLFEARISLLDAFLRLPANFVQHFFVTKGGPHFQRPFCFNLERPPPQHGEGRRGFGFYFADAACGVAAGVGVGVGVLGVAVGVGV
jgi:hypothetical protein